MLHDLKRTYTRPVAVTLGAQARGAGACSTGSTNIELGCITGVANQSWACDTGGVNYGVYCEMGGVDLYEP